MNYNTPSKYRGICTDSIDNNTLNSLTSKETQYYLIHIH